MSVVLLSRNVMVPVVDVVVTSKLDIFATLHTIQTQAVEVIIHSLHGITDNLVPFYRTSARAHPEASTMGGHATTLE